MMGYLSYGGKMLVPTSGALAILATLGKLFEENRVILIPMIG